MELDSIIDLDRHHRSTTDSSTPLETVLARAEHTRILRNPQEKARRDGHPCPLRSALWLFCLVTLSGCAGYQLGPTNGLAAGEMSVQISPFANQTLQPRLTDAVAMELRKELQRDGTYRLDTHGEGDILLTGTITSYQRSEVTVSANDVLTVQDFRLALTVHVTARERSTGKVLLDQPVIGTTLIRVGSDITSAERQGVPLLANDLAKNVTALLADGKW